MKTITEISNFISRFDVIMAIAAMEVMVIWAKNFPS